MRVSQQARWKEISRDAEGSEIVEAALTLPIVFMLLFAIIFFGRAYNVYSTITYAAREGAKVAVLGVGAGCATCSPTPPAASDVANRVNQVLQASHIDPGQIQTYTPTLPADSGNCGGRSQTSSGGVTVYTNAQLNPSTSTPPACGVIVSFQYPFTFFAMPFTSLNQQTINLTAAAQMPGEN